MFVRVDRSSREKPWNISLSVVQLLSSKESVQTVAAAQAGEDDQGLREGDIIATINWDNVGSDELKALKLVLFRLKQEVDTMMEVFRGSVHL
jgi:hypothetical protein